MVAIDSAAGRPLRPRHDRDPLGDPDRRRHRPGARSTPPARDPIPHIVKGIPIHLRDVRVYIDRPGFTVNPTSCDPETIASTLSGSGAALRRPGRRRCSPPPAPPTRPSTAARSASGRGSRCGCAARSAAPSAPRCGSWSGHARATPTSARPTVTLPPSIFLNQDHIGGSAPGPSSPPTAARRAPSTAKPRAFTPLLAQPLRGQGLPRSSDNLLPDLVFALRGQGFAVDLAGRIDSARGGRLRATFATVPDAPVTKFVARMFGGQRGILENGDNLCASPAGRRHPLPRPLQPRLAEPAAAARFLPAGQAR